MLFEKMVAFYEQANWQMQEVGDGNDTIMAANYRGSHGQWIFFASSDEDNRIIILFSRFPDYCPPERMDIMSQFLELSNFRMTHGAWIMDRRDGEIRYRVGVDMGDMELTDDYLRDLTFYTNMTVDQYFPGLRAIIHEGKSPQEAFELVFPNIKRSM